MTPSPSGGRPQQTRRSARTRERILDAATQTFARRGFHGTRVADIAEHAGIAYGLVYHHFKNKDEILETIYIEKWGQYLAYLSDVATRPLNFAERLSRLVHFWVETYHQEPHLMTVMINEISRSYEFLEAHDLGAFMAAFDPIERIIIEGKEAGEIRADIDSRLAAYAVLGVGEMVLTGYVMGSLIREDREQLQRDEDQLVAMLLGGLSPSR